MEVFICCSYDFIFLFKFYCKIIDLFIKKNNIKRSVILKKSNLCLIFYWLVKILICLAKPETGGFCHHHVTTLFCWPRCRRGDSFLKIWPTSKSQSEIIDWLGVFLYIIIINYLWSCSLEELRYLLIKSPRCF